MTSIAVSRTVEEVRSAVAEARQRGLTIGLVPTMGALHAGHASLIETAAAETGFVVVSIFVNPTQFGPNEDLDRYPRSLEPDLKICEAAGGKLVFVPEVGTMYPSEFHTFVTVERLQDGLCGANRPGHFRGVATVVLKLFHIVQPDVAYFGQKDAQQARILQQMVHDLNLPVRLRVCPIVREADGLALSSRNRYLDPEQRRHATVLYRSLQKARSLIEAGERDASRIQSMLKARVAATPGAVLDYAEVVDAGSLRPVQTLRETVLIALAVKFGGTRLIDNVQVAVT
jgi:pantoate--beta-alanine ligase